MYCMPSVRYWLTIKQQSFDNTKWREPFSAGDWSRMTTTSEMSLGKYAVPSQWCITTTMFRLLHTHRANQHSPPTHNAPPPTHTQPISIHHRHTMLYLLHNQPVRVHRWHNAPPPTHNQPISIHHWHTMLHLLAPSQSEFTTDTMLRLLHTTSQSAFIDNNSNSAY